ncbi:MAG: class I SAM-dependent methyltransferase [Oscillospiraceae bacterium]|nr:class I SAM-dependent methyltransferase [Oscillospiraceae bacterium]
MSEIIKWDQAADDYQRVYLLGLSEYNTSLLLFWREQGMIWPGSKVLDIGCGVGRYGAYLAELGCELTLTDISGEMLRRAREIWQLSGRHGRYISAIFMKQPERKLCFPMGLIL